MSLFKPTYYEDQNRLYRWIIRTFGHPYEEQYLGWDNCAEFEAGYEFQEQAYLLRNITSI